MSKKESYQKINYFTKKKSMSWINFNKIIGILIVISFVLCFLGLLWGLPSVNFRGEINYGFIIAKIGCSGTIITIAIWIISLIVKNR